MISSILERLVEIMIGFASGLGVGAGFVGFITVLGVIPRLVHLSKTGHLLSVYSTCIVSGLLMGTYLSFTELSWGQPLVVLVIWGGFHGIFNGMLAAALTEVLNVFPILSKRIGLDSYLLSLLMAIMFGKVAGSLFQWFIFVK